MANTPSSDNLLLGKGQCFFSRFDDNGVATGFRHFGNVETLELTTDDDVLDKYSSQSAEAPLYKRVTRRRTVTLRASLDEFEAHNVALALMGDVAQSTAQAATAVVAEVLTTTALKGGYYKTAKMGPITAVTLDNSTTTTPLVLGTDYVIADADLGLIHILATATAVAAGDDITISYTPTAYASGLTQISGGSDNKIEGAFMFVGDPTTGPAYLLEVWKVSVAPDGAIGLISDDYAQFNLTMTVEDDSANHPSPNNLYTLTERP